MPSVNSSSMPNVLDSSTVTTPSLPTLSMASASTSPMAGSAAEMAATWAISDLSSISLAWSWMASTAAATAFSMPRLRPVGLAPAATLRRPSCTSDWASTVAVVVPSPAVSLVLLTPVSRARRAWSSNLRILGISGSLLHDGEHVARREDEHVVALDRDLGAAVLAVQDGVADAHADGDDLAGLIGALARADGQDLALLRLFLGGVGDDQATRGGLLALTGLHDDPIVEGLQVHACRLHWRSPANPEWVSSLPISSANARPRRLALATRECQRAHHVGLAGVSRPKAGAGWGWRRGRAVTARRSAAATLRRRRSWRRCRCTSTGWGRTAGCRPRRTPRPGASAEGCWPPPRHPGRGPWRPRRARPCGPWRRARRRRPPESSRRRRPWRRGDACARG